MPVAADEQSYLKLKLKLKVPTRTEHKISTELRKYFPGKGDE
jgi:hypothetical protein